MQLKKAKVIALYRNKIVYKNYRKLQRKHFALAVMSFVFCVLGVFGITFSGLQLSSAIKQVSVVYKDPASPLYSDMSDIVFTSAGLVDNYNAGKDVMFKLPVVSSQVDIDNNQINIVIEDILKVGAIGDGVVTKIGKNDKGKYVVINHDQGLYSTISNLSIIGVVIGDYVTAGQSIGVATQNSSINVKIEYNGQTTNIELDGDQIKWTH